MKKMIYMAVTPDKYELPLCVGTCEEVAAYAGITVNNLQSQISKTKKGKCSGRLLGRRFVSVEE